MNIRVDHLIRPGSITYFLGLSRDKSYSHIAIGRKEVLRYSMMSLWRKGGNVAKVEIIV